MEQVINIQDIKKLLPAHAQVTFSRKKGEVGTYLSVEVRIKPPISEKEHNAMVQKIIDSLGEDLLEVYTEETGHWFFIYIRMSSTVPTTVIP